MIKKHNSQGMLEHNISNVVDLIGAADDNWWHQAITWANFDPDLCRHMVSLGHI